MKLFLSDLDNTLIYSYKYKSAGDVCIEYNKGKEQGFMTPYSFRLFDKIVNRVCFIPVTTRSIEQYNRINWPRDYKPKYEVVANGGILFKDSVLCDWWYQIAKDEFNIYQKKLLQIQQNLISSGVCVRCRLVNQLYLYAHCKEDFGIEELIKYNWVDTDLNIVVSGKKIYFFPPHLNKGNALIKLKEKLNPETIIAAGDSIIDIPMLELADIALVPNEFIAMKIGTNTNIIICPKNKNFSDFVIEKVCDIS